MSEAWGMSHPDGALRATSALRATGPLRATGVRHIYLIFIYAVHGWGAEKLRANEN